MTDFPDIHEWKLQVLHLPETVFFSNSRGSSKLSLDIKFTCVRYIPMFDWLLLDSQASLLEF